ncbi:MAG: FAD-binding oxidoreductase [Pseudomonadota bacterium]
METRDVVIVGGGAVGAAVACWLKAFEGFEGSVTVIERDPSYAHASTALAASGIRLQFSTPENIALSRYGLEVIRDFPARMATPDGPGPDLGFKEQGYLFLAATEAQERSLRAAHEVQRAEGVEVALLSPDEIAARFPHLNVGDLRLGSLGLRDEGWFDNMGLLHGFRAKARAAGATFVHDEVAEIARVGGRATEVRCASGRRIGCGILVNAAGPRAGAVAALAGLELPVGPRKRTVFVFDCQRRPEGRLPLMIDPTGLWSRPEGERFIAGLPPEPDPEVAPDDFEAHHDIWEERIWPALAERSPAFEAIKVKRIWVGHYEWNAVDQNGILGPHPECGNFLLANGFSGHGLQQSAGVGRAIAERIMTGGWRTIDLAALEPGRLFDGTAVQETAVV